MGLTYKNDPDILEETIQQLQTSGIQFSIKFLGSLIVSTSINSMNHQQQSEIARDSIKMIVNQLSAQKARTNGKDQDEDANVSLYDEPVDIIITSASIMLIRTTIFSPKDPSAQILHRFKIQDVSLLSTEKEHESIFCFFAKESKNGETIRKCFVFDAFDSDELNEVRDTISFAFKLNASETRELNTPSTSAPPPMNTLDQPNIIRDRSPTISVEISPNRYKEITKDLSNCGWYHNRISRQNAEAMIKEDGQFLVRKSPNIANQFVLSGMYNGSIKHVCLVSADSKICSAVGEFRSIAHLINYYETSRQPLVSHGAILMLSNPIISQSK